MYMHNILYHIWNSCKFLQVHVDATVSYFFFWGGGGGRGLGKNFVVLEMEWKTIGLVAW